MRRHSFTEGSWASHQAPAVPAKVPGGGVETKALAPPSPTGPGDHGSGLRVAPARRPEAPRGQGLPGRVSAGTGREETWACWAIHAPGRLAWSLYTGPRKAPCVAPGNPPGSPRHPLLTPLLGDPPGATGPGATLPPSPTPGGSCSALCRGGRAGGPGGHSVSSSCVSCPGLPVPVLPGARLRGSQYPHLLPLPRLWPRQLGSAPLGTLSPYPAGGRGPTGQRQRHKVGRGSCDFGSPARH